jgi:hypothetical protein
MKEPTPRPGFFDTPQLLAVGYGRELCVLPDVERDFFMAEVPRSCHRRMSVSRAWIYGKSVTLALDTTSPLFAA